MGKTFFNILATFAEFEVDLIRMRTREGMAVARAQGRLKGRQPKLSSKQQRELKKMLGYFNGVKKRLFNVSGSDYRALNLKEELSKMSDKEAIDLLSGNGNLVKMPFVLA